MKKGLLFLCVVLLVSKNSFPQGVGIGTTTPNASAALDITTTSKGLLIPRMSTAFINAIISPAKGLLVYDSLTNQMKANIGTAAIPNWQSLTAGSASVWNLTGNSGINPANQFIGNTDNQPLRFRVNNIQTGELHPVSGNVSWGLHAGESNTSGFSNIAIGNGALKLNKQNTNLVAIGDSALFNSLGDIFSDESISNTAIGSKSLFANTTGSENTAIGFNTLFSNTTGNGNVATGYRTLFANTLGTGNTASGFNALSSNTTGSSNTAMGELSLFINRTGHNNTAVGESALFSNTTGFSNVAIGTNALKLNTFISHLVAIGDSALFNNGLGVTQGSSNIDGIENTAIGSKTLFSNLSGSHNTAIGFKSLFANNVGRSNTAIGVQSLFANIAGGNNTAIGEIALFENTNGTANTAIGWGAMASNTVGFNNVAIGVNALASNKNTKNNTAIGNSAAGSFTPGDNNTFLGANTALNQAGLTNCVAVGESAVCTASNQVRLGNATTASIGGIVGYTTIPSDGRYKKNIQEDVKGIDFIMKLRPVTYQLDMERINKTLNLNAGDKTDGLLKESIDEKGKIIFSGFIAQEVEQAAKAAGYDFSGVDKPKNVNDIYGLRYAEFVVPLVKAVQELQQKIDELIKQKGASQQIINELRKRLDDLEKKK